MDQSTPASHIHTTHCPSHPREASPTQSHSTVRRACKLTTSAVSYTRTAGVRCSLRPRAMTKPSGPATTILQRLPPCSDCHAAIRPLTPLADPRPCLGPKPHEPSVVTFLFRIGGPRLPMSRPSALFLALSFGGRAVYNATSTSACTTFSDPRFQSNFPTASTVQGPVAPVPALLGAPRSFARRYIDNLAAMPMTNAAGHLRERPLPLGSRKQSCAVLPWIRQ